MKYTDKDEIAQDLAARKEVANSYANQFLTQLNENGWDAALSYFYELGDSLKDRILFKIAVYVAAADLKQNDFGKYVILLYKFYGEDPHLIRCADENVQKIINISQQ